MFGLLDDHVVTDCERNGIELTFKQSLLLCMLVTRKAVCIVLRFWVSAVLLALNDWASVCCLYAMIHVA